MSEEVEEYEEYAVEETFPTTDAEMIYAMHNAISAADYVDGSLLGVEKNKRNILRKAVLVMEYFVTKIYDENIGFCQPEDEE
jgi:hypothetical protein